jgi:hypothetical protein
MYRVTKRGGLLAFTIAPHVAHLRVHDVFSAGWELLEVGFWVWGNGRPVRQDRLKRCFDLVYFCGKGTRSLFTNNARMANRANAITGRRGKVTARAGGLGSQFHDCKKPRSYECAQDDYHPANVSCSQDDAPFGTTGYELLFAVKRLLPVGKAREKHPTKKPLDLFGQIIKLTSREGDTVLDPFMGDGTTGESSLLLDRLFVGIEAVPEYFERANRNIMAVEAQLRCFLLPHANNSIFAGKAPQWHLHLLISPDPGVATPLRGFVVDRKDLGKMNAKGIDAVPQNSLWGYPGRRRSDTLPRRIPCVPPKTCPVLRRRFSRVNWISARAVTIP